MISFIAYHATKFIHSTIIPVQFTLLLKSGLPIWNISSGFQASLPRILFKLLYDIYTLPSQSSELHVLWNFSVEYVETKLTQLNKLLN